MKKALLFTLLVAVWVIVIYPKDIVFDALRYYGNKKGIHIKSNEYKIETYILYNRLDLKKIDIFGMINIDDIDIRNNILHPMVISFVGKSQYGNFIGKINLYKKAGAIIIKNNNIQNSILNKYFKKTKEGMRYDFSL